MESKQSFGDKQNLAELIGKTTKIFKLIGDPTRLKIMVLLEGHECSVSDLAQRIPLEQSALSHQLKKLKDANLIKNRRLGKNVLYSQADAHVFEIIRMGLKHAEHTRPRARLKRTQAKKEA